jgi:hypothetical protein
MRTEDAYGLVLMESGQRYRVSAAAAGGGGGGDGGGGVPAVGLFCVWFLHVQVGVLARAAP